MRRYVVRQIVICALKRVFVSYHYHSRRTSVCSYEIVISGFCSALGALHDYKKLKVKTPSCF